MTDRLMNWSERAICCFNNLPCLAITYLYMKCLDFPYIQPYHTFSSISLPFSLYPPPPNPPEILKKWRFYERKLSDKVSPNTSTINQDESGLLCKVEAKSREREITWKQKGERLKQGCRWGCFVSENVSSARKLKSKVKWN